jgi:hypothetical protein
MVSAAHAGRYVRQRTEEPFPIVRRWRALFSRETEMKKAEELRNHAENCAELAQAATSAPNKKRFERMAEGWKTVADNQAWLDGEDSRAKPFGVDGATQ